MGLPHAIKAVLDTIWRCLLAFNQESTKRGVNPVMQRGQSRLTSIAAPDPKRQAGALARVRLKASRQTAAGMLGTPNQLSAMAAQLMDALLLLESTPNRLG